MLNKSLESATFDGIPNFYPARERTFRIVAPAQYRNELTMWAEGKLADV